MTIELADRLLRDGHITQAERDLLIVRDSQIYDDSRFPAEVTDSGDVYIHARGAYPVILRGYAVK